MDIMFVFMFIFMFVFVFKAWRLKVGDDYGRWEVGIYCRHRPWAFFLVCLS